MNLYGSTGYIVDLGLIDYQEAWDFFRSLWSRRVADSLPDVFLLLEHPPCHHAGQAGESLSIFMRRKRG